MYQCEELDCFECLHACGSCIVLAHRQRPFHRLWKWAKGDNGWNSGEPYLTNLGFIWQRGHDGLPCPSPSPEVREKMIIGFGKVRYRTCLCWEKEMKQSRWEAEVRRETELQKKGEEREEAKGDEEDWETTDEEI
ncbi:hypothetical protein DFH06DRAFT_1120442 [Mycena polygramma]|nr:hypothetical protein DFH06DRAFT_1120442 [Mycena polygramma]